MQVPAPTGTVPEKERVMKNLFVVFLAALAFLLIACPGGVTPPPAKPKVELSVDDLSPPRGGKVNICWKFTNFKEESKLLLGDGKSMNTVQPTGCMEDIIDWPKKYIGQVMSGDGSREEARGEIIIRPALSKESGEFVAKWASTRYRGQVGKYHFTRQISKTLGNEFLQARVYVDPSIADTWGSNMLQEGLNYWRQAGINLLEVGASEARVEIRAYPTAQEYRGNDLGNTLGVAYSEVLFKENGVVEQTYAEIALFAKQIAQSVGNDPQKIPGRAAAVLKHELHHVLLVGWGRCSGHHPDDRGYAGSNGSREGPSVQIPDYIAAGIRDLYSRANGDPVPEEYAAAAASCDVEPQLKNAKPGDRFGIIILHKEDEHAELVKKL